MVCVAWRFTQSLKLNPLGLKVAVSQKVQYTHRGDAFINPPKSYNKKIPARCSYFRCAIHAVVTFVKTESRESPAQLTDHASTLSEFESIFCKGRFLRSIYHDFHVR
jgi:hypothetical protein